MKRFFDFLRRHARQLVQLHDTPHAIAGGVAIGVYIGFFPPLGFKVVSAILIAWVFRCSRVAAAVTVNWHDICWVIPPLFALLLRVEYGIGYWLLNSPHHWPEKIRVASLKPEQWLHWKALLKMVKMIWPTILGSAILALPFAVAAFIVYLRIVRRYQARRRAADAAALDLNIGGL